MAGWILIFAPRTRLCVCCGIPFVAKLPRHKLCLRCWRWHTASDLMRRAHRLLAEEGA